MANSQFDGQPIFVRLSQQQREELDARCEMLGVTKAAYARSLITIPAFVDQDYEINDGGEIDFSKGFHFFVYDKRTYSDLKSQLRAWGYHYNQAVHALNIIVARRNMQSKEALELIGRCFELVNDIDKYRREINDVVDQLLPNESIKLRS